MNQKCVSCLSARDGVRVLAIVFALISTVQMADAVPVTVEAGVSTVETSGLRRYAARLWLTENRTSSLAAPQLRVSMPVGESFVVGAGYGYYGTFRGFGVAPTPDIFGEGGIVIQVLTPFASAEKIHEASIDLRFHRPVSAGIEVEIGPTLSLFHSKATIWNRSFTANDVRVGGAASVRFPLAGPWSVSAGYRCAAPPERTLHLLTLTVSRSL